MTEYSYKKCMEKFDNHPDFIPLDRQITKDELDYINRDYSKWCKKRKLRFK